VEGGHLKKMINCNISATFSSILMKFGKMINIDVPSQISYQKIKIWKIQDGGWPTS